MGQGERARNRYLCTDRNTFAPTATFSAKGNYVLQATASDGALTGTATVAVEARQAALLVTGPTGDPGDTLLSSRLTALSFDVTAMTGAAATAASATGKSVVVISPTTVAADVTTKFNTVTVPVVTMNEALFDDNRLTTTANLGSLTGQTTVSIAVPSHPLAAGLSGSAQVTTTLSSFAWGVPAGGGVKVATLASDSTKATVFYYEQGSAMTSGTAPKRRVGLFLRSDTVTSSMRKAPHYSTRR